MVHNGDTDQLHLNRDYFRELPPEDIDRGQGRRLEWDVTLSIDKIDETKTISHVRAVSFLTPDEQVQYNTLARTKIPGGACDVGS